MRGKEHDDAIVGSGGLILSRVRLSAPAAAALAVLMFRHGTQRKAVETALIEAAERERE